MKRTRRVIRLMVMFYAATLALVLASNQFWPRDTRPENAEQVICLGGGAAQGVLFESSQMRAEHCGQLILDGVAARVLVTGHGAGTLMADHIREMGVPDALISLEPLSRSTLQNALFSSRMTRTDAPVIIVTDAYHLLRSWVAFRVMGFEDVRLSSSPAMVDEAKPLLREVSAIWFNALRLVIYGATVWLERDLREALLA